MRNDETGKKDCSRRNFLQTVGAGVPTLKLMLDGVAGVPPAVRPEPPFDSNKFTPLDISRHATATARDFGAREQARGLLGCEQDGLVRTLAGEQKLRGIPFLLAPEGPETKRWTALSGRRRVPGAVSLPQVAAYFVHVARALGAANGDPPVRTAQVPEIARTAPADRTIGPARIERPLGTAVP